MTTRRKALTKQCPNRGDKQARFGWGSVVAFGLIVPTLIGGLWIGRSFGAKPAGPSAPQSEAAASATGSSEAPAPTIGSSEAPAPTIGSSEAPAPTIVTDLTTLPPGPADHIEVAYFHRTHRCWSCTEAERLVRKALDERFADHMASGRMSLVVVDVEQPENADIAARYDAWGSSLYLGVTKAGSMYVYPVADIWYTIRDENQFVPALADKISVGLGGS